MFYNLISHNFNPNCAQHNIGLEMTLEVMSFGLELLPILYQEASNELPSPKNFHERLYEFVLGYFAAGVNWHTTNYKLDMDHIVDSIKEILSKLRAHKKPFAETSVGYTIKPVHNVQTEDYSNSTLLAAGNDASHLDHLYDTAPTAIRSKVVRKG
jgi:hypothetical protein